MYNGLKKKKDKLNKEIININKEIIENIECINNLNNEKIYANNVEHFIDIENSISILEEELIILKEKIITKKRKKNDINIKIYRILLKKIRKIN